MEIKQKLIPIGTERRSGVVLGKVTYIVCHDTANDGATALDNVNYYIKSANDIQASAHAFVDDLGVLECIPLTEKAWHVRYNAGIAPNLIGNYANDHAIGVELCYTTRGNFDALGAYKNYVTYIALLLKEYNLTADNLVAHGTLDPTRRTDPFNAFGKLGKTWDNFISDIKVELQTTTINLNKNMNTTYVKFFNSSTHEVVTVFTEQGYKVQNDGQTFDFATAQEAQEKSNPEVFVFWDNAPVGSGTSTPTE